MSLKVELKPFERIIIGQSVITNSETRTRLLIDGKAPILREKDILTAETGKPRAEVYGNELFYVCDTIGFWARCTTLGSMLARSRTRSSA